MCVLPFAFLHAWRARRVSYCRASGKKARSDTVFRTDIAFFLNSQFSITCVLCRTFFVCIEHDWIVARRIPIWYIGTSCGGCETVIISICCLYSSHDNDIIYFTAF